VIPLPDVQIGAADTGVPHADEDVGWTTSGARDFPEHHPGTRTFLDESAHEARVGDGRKYSPKRTNTSEPRLGGVSARRCPHHCADLKLTRRAR
jgi:hypothetical protein